MQTNDAVKQWLLERQRSGEITPRTTRLLECRFPTFLEMFGDQPVSGLDRRAIRQWSQRIGGYAPATRRAYLSTIGCFCRWCVDEGLLAEDVTRHVSRVREPRRIPRARQHDEVQRIYLHCHTLRDRAIIALMVQMGLRSVEISRLETGDWDMQAATMRVRGKAGHERLLPVPTRAAEELCAYRDSIPSRPGPLICDRRVHRHGLTSSAIQKVVSNIMREAGVKQYGHDGVTPHTIRHTAASDVLNECGNVRVVQNMLGHASLATTEMYLRIASIDQLREAMEGRDYRPALRGMPESTGDTETPGHPTLGHPLGEAS
jgi:site-specific recombinase XerD